MVFPRNSEPLHYVQVLKVFRATFEQLRLPSINISTTK